MAIDARVYCDIITEGGRPMAGYITDSAPGLIGQLPLDGGEILPATGDRAFAAVPAADEVLHDRGFVRTGEWEEGATGGLSAPLAPAGQQLAGIGSEAGQ